MAAITKNEIITLAFTRNISEDHILDSDITIAKRMYVDAYLDGITDESTIYDDYVKPVIAFGVLSNIFNRIAYEITDRGMVAMVNQGASNLDAESKLSLLSEIRLQLVQLIKLMIEAADETITQEFEMVGFTGNLKQAKL